MHSSPWCNMKSSFPLAAFFFLIAVPTFAQEAAEAQAAEAVEEVANAEVAIEMMSPDRVQQSVAQELKILQGYTKLSDQSIEGLKLGLKPFLAVEKKRLGRSGVFFGNTELLSPGTLDSLAKAAESIVEDKASVERYRKDVKARVNFHRSATVSGLLASVNSWVGLTAEQVEQVGTITGRLYDEGKLTFSPSIDFESLGGEAKLKPIEEILTEEQRRYFKKFGKERAGGFAGVSSEDIDKSHEKLKAKLRDVAAMKIGYLRTELNLTPKQVRRLELLGKRVVSTALALRVKAEDKYRKYMLDAQAGVPARFEQDTMSIVSAHPVQLFETQDEWNKFVTGALNDGQKSKYKKLTFATGKRNADMLGYLLVMSLTRQLTLNGEQQTATRKLFSESFGPIPTPSMGGLGMMETYAKLLAISEDDYSAAMGNENWNKFKPMLGQVRQQLDQMKEQEATEDEND